MASLEVDALSPLTLITDAATLCSPMVRHVELELEKLSKPTSIAKPSLDWSKPFLISGTNEHHISRDKDVQCYLKKFSETIKMSEAQVREQDGRASSKLPDFLSAAVESRLRQIFPGMVGSEVTVNTSHAELKAAQQWHAWSCAQSSYTCTVEREMLPFVKIAASGRREVVATSILSLTKFMVNDGVPKDTVWSAGKAQEPAAINWGEESSFFFQNEVFRLCGSAAGTSLKRHKKSKTAGSRRLQVALQEFWKSISRDKLEKYLAKYGNAYYATCDHNSILYCPFGTVVAERVAANEPSVGVKLTLFPKLQKPSTQHSELDEMKVLIFFWGLGERSDWRNPC